jgi:hypothetical protein
LKSWRWATRSSSGREPSADTLLPRKVASDSRKTHFAGLIRIRLSPLTA